MEGESGATRSITDELHSSDIKGDQVESKSGITRSIIDELHSSDIQRDQMEVGISKQMKWKVKARCYW